MRALVLSILLLAPSFSHADEYDWFEEDSSVSIVIYGLNESECLQEYFSAKNHLLQEYGVDMGWFGVDDHFEILIRDSMPEKAFQGFGSQEIWDWVGLTKDATEGEINDAWCIKMRRHYSSIFTSESDSTWTKLVDLVMN